MVSAEYANAYSEVLEILKYISKEEYNKIPKEKVNLFETYANTNYKFSYDPDKTLDEQGVSKRTKAIIAILFRDYWATEAQREKIHKKQNYDRQKLEEQKQAKYNTDIFKNKQKETPAELKNIKKNHKETATELVNIDNQNNPPEQNAEMTVYKNNIFKKLIYKVLKFFRKKCK